MSRSEPPILLTQICGSCRNVAHDTPRLWKSMHIAVPYNKLWRYSAEHPNFSSTIEYDRRSEAVVEWLTRSVTYPLDISVGHLESNGVDGFYHKIIDSLIRFSD